MRILFLLILAGVMGVGFWHALFDSPNLIQLKHIEIKGASPETEKRLRGLLRSQIGDPFWKIRVVEEAKRMMQDPWVEMVEVQRHLGTLSVDILEKKPVAILSDGKGSFQFIDRHSETIDAADTRQIGSYPVLSESGFKDNKELRKQALGILETLPEQGHLSRDDISELQFDRERGFHLTLAKTGIVVGIGKENLPLHLDRARRVVQYLDQHQIAATHIDADYSKKVLVKLKHRR